MDVSIVDEETRNSMRMSMPREKSMVLMEWFSFNFLPKLLILYLIASYQAWSEIVKLCWLSFFYCEVVALRTSSKLRENNLPENCFSFTPHTWHEALKLFVLLTFVCRVFAFFSINARWFHFFSLRRLGLRLSWISNSWDRLSLDCSAWLIEVILFELVWKLRARIHYETLFVGWAIEGEVADWNVRNADWYISIAVHVQDCIFGCRKFDEQNAKNDFIEKLKPNVRRVPS